MAVATLGALNRYQSDLVYYIAFTDASPSRKASFLEEQGDKVFERLRRANSGDPVPGSLKDNPGARQALEYYRESLKIMGGLAPSVAIHEKLATLYSYLGDEDRRAQSQARAFLHNRDFLAAADATAGCESVSGRVLRAEALFGAEKEAEARELATRLQMEYPDEPRRHVPDGGRGGARWPRAGTVPVAGAGPEGAAPANFALCRIIDAIPGHGRPGRSPAHAWPRRPGIAKRSQSPPPPRLVQLEAGNAEEAVKSFKKAIDILGNHAPLWLDLRRAYLESGKDAQARMALQRAIAIDANLVDERLGQ